ncbi:MAG: DNA polymerase III subunit delta' [Clostridium sp.]|nr:DNA polymerase III subunit delta' [Clostridium sp.]MCM1398652.1 DNA polymerase III subunit delta' [Clostridium sp.]MCM1459937.1 DNA polymerase III subunit delta' [Bacteroides sp.]
MIFKHIVGHEDIIRHFKSSIEMGKVSHAYILNGEVDSGKKMLARVFARTLQCEEGGTEPCGKCQSCLQAETMNHPDIITITHEKPDVISVEEIRQQLVESIGIKPYKSKYKIYIVPDAQLMNVQAQNALLKTIEEPPEYGVIMLLTSNIDKLLPTVTSRCMVLNTKPIRERDMLEYLVKELGLTEDRAYFCLDFAQGNLGKAIKLAKNEEYSAIVDSVVKVLKKIHELDVDDLTTAVSHIEQFKLSIDDYMDLMMMWYRDVLMLKVTGNIDKLLFKQEYSTMKKQAGLMSFQDIEEKINAIARAKERIMVHANFDVTMELLLLTLKEN